MSETSPLKPLTKGNCMNDLVPYYQFDLSKQTPMEVAMKLSVIYERAKEETRKKDEEKAFILNMRWLMCAKWIQKTEEYKNDKRLFKGYFDGNLVKEVLKMAEELSKNLKVRYQAMKEQNFSKEENIIPKTDAVAMVLELSMPKTSLIGSNLGDQDEEWVLCDRLVYLIQDASTEMLLIDIRTNKEYLASRIKYEKCINIPADKIKPGLTPWDFGEFLLEQDEDSLEFFSPFRTQRIEHIILLDSNSNRWSLIPDSPLNLLKTILLNWDPGVACKRISILEGGHNEMVKRYPTLINNPCITTKQNIQNPGFGSGEKLEYRELLSEWDEEEEKEELKPQSQNTNVSVTQSLTSCSLYMNVMNLIMSSQTSDNSATMSGVEDLREQRRGMLTPKKDKTYNDNDAFEALQFSIKRSYSSPNLVQLDDGNGTPIRWRPENSLPRIDRSSKQHQNRHDSSSKNLVSSQDQELGMNSIFANVITESLPSQQPGVTGLKNLGNSCYMNSIVQCLSNSPFFAEYFIDDTYADDLNTSNRGKTSGLVVKELAQVIKALWSKQHRSLSPRDFKSACGQYMKQFASCGQEDCQEFLTLLLDWMHNDLKKNIKSHTGKSLSNAEKEWNKAVDGQSSIISQLFFGQLGSTVHCATCGKSSTTYQTFSTLTVSLPSSIECTLDERIRIYMSEQKVFGWTCPSCKVARDAMQKFDFAKLAPIIVIHLNRFSDSEGFLKKKDTAVEFPLNGLNLHRYLIIDSRAVAMNNNEPQQHYSLYAVSNHYGTMSGGHYTAYCKNTYQNKWYHYDDHRVTEVSPVTVKSAITSAYLLFYTCLQNTVS